VDNVESWLVVETSDVDGVLEPGVLEAGAVVGMVLVRVVVIVVKPVLQVET